MAAFLFKTEPSEYAFEDLVHERRTVWQGVKNPLALKHLRSVAKGDTVVIYHTGTVKAAVGLARAATGPYADPALDDPRRAVVDLTPVRPLERPLLLAEFREDPVLATTDLARLPRLSVMPLTAAHLARIEKLARG